MTNRVGACKYCRQPIQRRNRNFNDTLAWTDENGDAVALHPTPHHHTAPHNGEPAPRHCNTPAERRPSGWWCRSCRQALPQQPDGFYPLPAAAGLITRLCPGPDLYDTRIELRHQIFNDEPVTALNEAITVSQRTNNDKPALITAARALIKHFERNA